LLELGSNKEKERFRHWQNRRLSKPGWGQKAAKEKIRIFGERIACD
jgi:hypothetical protein